MIALTKTGAQKYFPSKARVFFVLSDAEQCDAIAESVANGESLASAGRSLGLSYFVTQRRWARICAGLRSQAV